MQHSTIAKTQELIEKYVEKPSSLFLNAKSKTDLENMLQTFFV